MTKGNKSTTAGMYDNNIGINVFDVEHNNCTKYEIDKLIDIFELLVKKAIKLPSERHLYLLDDITRSRGLPRLALSIERSLTDKTNRLFDDTKNFDTYIGTFTNEYGDQTLTVMATVFNKTTDRSIYYKGCRTIEPTLGLGDHELILLPLRPSKSAYGEEC